MSEKARSSPRWAFRRTPRSGWWQRQVGGSIAPRSSNGRSRFTPCTHKLPPVISDGVSQARAAAGRSGRDRRAHPRPVARTSLEVTTSGTGFVVWAVCGLTPSGSSIVSALPWSAVTRQTPPAASTAVDDHAEASVRGLDGLDDGRDRARVADHVRVREVDDREAVAVADLGREARGDLGARTSPASGRSSARRAGSGRGCASPPATLLDGRR